MFLSIYKISFLHNLVNENENSIVICTNFFLYSSPLLETRKYNQSRSFPKVKYHSNSKLTEFHFRWRSFCCNSRWPHVPLRCPVTMRLLKACSFNCKIPARESCSLETAVCLVSKTRMHCVWDSRVCCSQPFSLVSTASSLLASNFTMTMSQKLESLTSSRWNSDQRTDEGTVLFTTSKLPLTGSWKWGDSHTYAITDHHWTNKNYTINQRESVIHFFFSNLSIISRNHF